MMKVLICGSRDWPSDKAWWIGHALDTLGKLHGRGTVEVIHGASRGVDSIAASYARRFGMAEHAFPADWRGKGRAAGPIRNLTMLDQEPDLVLAFQSNGSRGTQHTIDEARKRDIDVQLHTA